nr:flagellar motor switch protein FliM [Ruficoccus amylovorans]
MLQRFSPEAVEAGRSTRIIGKSTPASTVEVYDFRQPTFMGETEMRRLRLMHEDFIRFLEARLSLFLRKDFSLKMLKLETLSYTRALDTIESPAHLALFRANPLPGIGFLEISPRLALTVASSILGGKGQAPNEARFLTKIEIDLIEEFLFIFLQEWCSQWKFKQHLEPQITGHEVVASVLQICEPDTVLFLLVMEAEVRGCSGQIQVGVPLYMIEPMVRHLKEERRREENFDTGEKVITWRRGYSNLPVTVKASFEVGKMPARNCARWQPGTFIPLDAKALKDVTLWLSNVALFQGEAGVQDGAVAVALKDTIKETSHVR